MRVDQSVGLSIFDLCKGLRIDLAGHVRATEPLLAREDSLKLVKLGGEVLRRGSCHLHGGLSLSLLLSATLNGCLFLNDTVVRRVPDLLIEVVIGIGRGWLLLCKHLSDKINSDLSVTLVVPGADIDEALGHLVLTGDQDVVPLSELCIPDLLVDLSLRAVHLGLIAKLMEVEVD